MNYALLSSSGSAAPRLATMFPLPVTRQILLLAVLMLAGCQYHADTPVETQPATSQSLPLTQPLMAMAECEELWHTTDQNKLADASLWLRTSECAERMTLAEARRQAKDHQGASWYEAFRQSILLNVDGSGFQERRQAYQRLVHYRTQVPASVYPLYKIWRQQQSLRLNLMEERSRGERELADNIIQQEIMQEQLRHLQHQLTVTTQKLQNLTDIERRLSSRKQITPDMPNAQSDDSTAEGKNALSDGETEGNILLPTKSKDRP